MLDFGDFLHNGVRLFNLIYQVELSCKDFACRAPSRVTQKIFAVLVVQDNQVVLTRSFKLISV